MTRAKLEEMSDAFETIVGKLCLDRGWLAREQLIECLKLCGSTVGGISPTRLSEVLISRGHVTPEQIELLRREFDASPAGAVEYAVIRREDILLGQMLVQRRRVPPEVVKKALAAQEAGSKRGGAAPRLGEILVKMGATSPGAIEEILVAQRSKSTFSCSSCHATYAIANPDPKKNYICKKCAGTLVMRDGSEAVTTASSKTTVPDEVEKARLNPKNVFGKYVVVKELGRGGMGAVYKAWDGGLKRWVAIKLLTAQGEGEELARFQREAQTAASLKHPGIVGIYEVGEHDDKHFIAMEYIEGQTLVGQRLSARKAVEVMSQVVEAVDYAHSKGVIHRDLKPHNIMIDGTGKPYVMDFGLAKSLKGESQITMSGTVVGTPSYMSPEQAQGKLTQVDKRSDIYSLGAVLYELLAGRPPFKGGTPVETLRRVVNDDPVPPTEVVKSTPKDVETIVLKCLEKDKARRYPSTRLLGEDLRRWLEGDEIAARPVSMATRVGKRLSKNKAPAIAAIVVVAAILIAFGVVFSSSSAKREEAEKQIAAADAAFAKGDWVAAREAYSAARRLEDSVEVRKKIEACDKKINEATEKRKAEERKEQERQEALEQEKRRKTDARAKAQPEFDAGHRKFEDAKLDLYRSGADLAKMEDKLKEALGFFTKAVEICPEYYEAFYQRGLVHFHLQNHGAAEADFTKAISLQKNLSDAYYERGRLFIERSTVAHGRSRALPSQSEKAKEYRKRANEDLLAFRRLASGSSELNDYALALLAYSEKDLAKSLDICNRLIAARTTNELVYKLAGDALELQAGGNDGVLADAEKAFTLAIERRANYFEAFLMRGTVRYERGNFNGALEDFTRAVEINGRVSEAHNARGVALTELKRRDEGRREFETALALDPNDSSALNNLGLLYYWNKDYKPAVEFFTRALAADESNVRAWCNRAATKRWLDDLDGALLDYEQALRRSPDFADVYFNRSFIHTQRKNWGEAVRDLTEFLKRYSRRDANLESALYTRGTSYYYLGQFREAIADWEKCLELETPRRETIEKWIGEAKKRLDN